MKLSAIIVCKDYGDFLEHTLPENLQHLDSVLVVTHENDKHTREICARYSVDCVTTHIFDEKNHAFNKGAAINVGIDNVRLDDNWLLHFDADIVLCRDFRRLLAHAQIKKDCIYGADRINVYGYESWEKLKPRITSHYQSSWFVDPGFCHAPELPVGVRLGARVIHKEYGYLPIGYFQLWHSSAGKRYNNSRGSAAGTDCMFPAQWPREKRILLPEIVCYHLDSESTHKIGTNWKGRKSKPFSNYT